MMTSFQDIWEIFPTEDFLLFTHGNLPDFGQCTGYATLLKAGSRATAEAVNQGDTKIRY
jgi:hypothetical protein